ncbi:hypothetical protein EDD19_12412 [Dietzia cinnamea]|uniref:Uncharacterized protein n=1 Tax=Dietzia cinnamea TaxID=321318 RepID=A0A4R3ZN43_9ACTN|nr:hypothetical protein EDD19_12412 [Dietzia cinnamea]
MASMWRDTCSGVAARFSAAAAASARRRCSSRVRCRCCSATSLGEGPASTSRSRERRCRRKPAGFWMVEGQSRGFSRASWLRTATRSRPVQRSQSTSSATTSTREPRCRPLSRLFAAATSWAATMCAWRGRSRSLSLCERPEGADARLRACVGEHCLRGVLLPVGPLRGRYDFAYHLRGVVRAHVDAARSCTPSWCTAAWKRSSTVRYRPLATSTASSSSARTARALETTSWQNGRERSASSAAIRPMVSLDAVTRRPVSASARRAQARATSRAVRAETRHLRHNCRPRMHASSAAVPASHLARDCHTRAGCRPSRAHERPR